MLMDQNMGRTAILLSVHIERGVTHLGYALINFFQSIEGYWESHIHLAMWFAA